MTPITDDRPALYFVSDVHLGGSPPEAEAEKRERLLELLDLVERAGASLYILGDLFDFWFTYRRVIPRTAFGVLARLQDLARRGTPVRYLGGNHDFWMESFLREDTAVQVLPERARVHAQGRILELVHGDGLGPGDRGYKVLKRILHNRVANVLFRWIHPDLGIGLGLRSSHVSRESTQGHRVDVDALQEHVARPALESGADTFLMGHHHVPIHRQTAGGDFVILGDWFRNYTCARLREGKIELLRWSNGSSLVHVNM